MRLTIGVMLKVMKNTFFIMLFTFLGLGCDMDPFGQSTKTIISPYELKQWEDFETYYLFGPEETGWGTIDGTVKKIGWNKRYILVLQNDDGNGGGWRIIDTDTRTKSGLILDEDLKNYPEIEGIETYYAEAAWRKL